MLFIILLQLNQFSKKYVVHISDCVAYYVYVPWLPAQLVCVFQPLITAMLTTYNRKTHRYNNTTVLYISFDLFKDSVLS